MSSVVYVTNRGETKLKDGFGGTYYEFKKDEVVEIPLDAAKHIFGYMNPNKEPYLARLGWIRSYAELDKGLERLAEFHISEQPPEKDRSLPSAVGVVPLHVEKRAGGKHQQQRTA